MASRLRHRIDGSDAALFLADFFKSLLVAPTNHAAIRLGNIELAVKSARHALNTLSDHPLSWAAPVVFRAVGKEPMFSFLSVPPAPLRHEIEKEVQAARREIWEALARVNWSQRKPGEGGLYDRIQNMLRGLEDRMLGEALAKAAVVMPERREVDPAGLQAEPSGLRLRAGVVLHKSIFVRKLTGTIVETTQGARIAKLTLTPEAAAAGFELMLTPLDASVVKFNVRRPAGDPGNLPEGPLLAAEFAIGPAIETVYQINIESLRSEPPVALCGAANAIIVPAP
jgi:hypothetical protein